MVTLRKVDVQGSSKGQSVGVGRDSQWMWQWLALELALCARMGPWLVRTSDNIIRGEKRSPTVLP